MSAIMVGVKYKSDSRDRHLHHGNWLLKLGVWILFVALPFLFPNNVVEAYGGCAEGDADGLSCVLWTDAAIIHSNPEF